MSNKYVIERTYSHGIKKKSTILVDDSRLCIQSGYSTNCSEGFCGKTTSCSILSCRYIGKKGEMYGYIDDMVMLMTDLSDEEDHKVDEDISC